MARSPSPSPSPSGSGTRHEEIALPTLKDSTLMMEDYSDAPAPNDRDDLVDPTHHPAELPEEEDHESSDDTATATSDEFDWDAEDDAMSTRHSMHVPSEGNTKARRGKVLWNLFMKLSRTVRTLIIGALGAGVLITPLIVVDVQFHSSPSWAHVRAWSLWLTISWAASIGTYLLIDSVPYFVLTLLRLLGYKVERLKTPIELMTAASGWLKLALDITWMWITLSVIRATYNPPGAYWVVVNRVMQALFSAGLLLLAEKIFLRYVAINFHRKALAERLAENHLGLTALDRLSNAHPAPASKKSPYPAGKKGHKSRFSSIDVFGLSNGSGGRGRGHVGDGTGSNDTTPPTASRTASRTASPARGGKEKEKEVDGVTNDVYSAQNSPDPYHATAGAGLKSRRRQQQKAKRNAVTAVIVDQLGGMIGSVALKDSKFNRDQFNSLASAGKLARKLFKALSDVYPPREHLIVEDFYPYFRTTADAHAAFALFDKDGNGDISKREMRNAVRRIYRERKALTSSLKDVTSAVAKLDAVLLGALLIVFMFICLLIFNRNDTIASLVPLASIIVGFSFIFGHSAQTLFESLIFIFSTHVYDVGDLVLIDDQPLFVREFGLFSTTFRRVDGQEIIAPNALLSSAKLVHNLRRSNSMWESTNLMCSYDTPLEVIEQLRTRLNTYVQQNSREWSSVSVNIDKMEYQNAIFLIVSMEHRPNWQDWGGRWGRRTAFMRHLKTVLEELDVRYSMPLQPLLLPKGVQPPGIQIHGSDKGSPRVNVRRPSSESMSGNAGSFRGSEYMSRSPSRSIQSGRDSFDGARGLGLGGAR